MGARTADLLTIILIVILVLGCYALFRTIGSQDLLGLWIAGKMHASSQTGSVYPADTTVFTMQPAAAWLTYIKDNNISDGVFPFIYPPIWAYVMGKVTAITDYETFRQIAGVVNPVLLSACVLVAHRIAVPDMQRPLYLLIGLVALMITSVGEVSVFQNQPQIFVSLLVLVAIERAEHGAPHQAGIALALAAALKLLPAIYVVFWLASGQHRAALTFVVAGAALAGLSVAVAGWPLHGDFLHMLNAISDTLMLTRFSYGIETTLGQIFYPSGWQRIALNSTVESLDGWYVAAKPMALAWLLRLGLLATIAGLALRFRRKTSAAERAALWGAATILIAALSPLAWSTYFIVGLCLAPLLLRGLGLLTGTVVLTGFVVLTCAFWPLFPRGTAGLLDPSATVGCMAVLGLGLAFCIAASRLARRDPASASTDFR